jgi:CubicO group peptidase (beta-lactamase class C family)
MRTLLIALVVGLAGLLASAQDERTLDRAVQAAVDDGTFMGAVLVARGDRILLDKGYGSANLEWHIPNTPATKFRVGSITKQFTAAAILLLEERGKLTVDDPVGRHLPDAPAAWSGITLRHLLTHSSGIANYTALPENRQLKAFGSTPAAMLALVRDRPLDFPPGEKMSYSNTGYIALGAIVERLSGQSYGAFLQDNIFGPLGMKDSAVDVNAAIVERRASGYAPSPNGPVNAGFIQMTAAHAAGSLMSTTGDLLRWERALFGGKVLSAASLQKMTTAFKGDYAFGLFVRERQGRKVFEHNGSIDGFNSAMSYYPESRVTVIVLANVNGPAADRLVTMLGRIAHGDEVRSRF